MSRARQPSLRPLPEARRLLLAAAPPLSGSEEVAAEDALGRVTTAPLRARASVPHYHGAAMDGIAVRADDTRDASPDRPAELTLGTPASTARPFSWVDTGNALPSWADAVVMIERVVDPRTGEPLAGRAVRTVRVDAPAAHLQHVRLVGEDVVASEPLLPRGHRIRAWDVGALLAAGVERVAVRRRPVVALLPTGDELIEPGEARRAGRIVEFNSRMIAALVREWGGEPRRVAPVGDNLDALRARIAGALRDADVVCVLAGSSAGEHDFTAEALTGFGEILVHGVAVMPGKPAIVSAVADPGARARVALGVPGYPVSAAVVCRELLEPLLAHLQGVAPAERPTLRAVVPQELRSRAGHEEMVRVSVGVVGGRTVAIPLGRGAGAITSLVRADGIVRIPAEAERVAAGSEVEVELLRSLDDVRGTVLVAGGDDAALAALEDVLRAGGAPCKLALRAASAGEALDALARGEAHVAVVGGPEAARAGATRTEGGAPPLVVPLGPRRHGLLVAAGNPLAIRTADDLARPDVRTLPATLPHGPHGGGAPTPLAAAAAVRSGLADAAHGPAWAADALEIGFVPLGAEDVSLVLRADFAASAAGRALVAALGDPLVRAALPAHDGDDVTDAGDASLAPRVGPPRGSSS